MTATATSTITGLGEIACADDLDRCSRLYQVTDVVEVAGTVVSRDTVDEGAGCA